MHDVVNHLVGVNLVFVALLNDQAPPERVAGRFGPAQTVDADAPAIDRLVAFLGRPLERVGH